MKKNPVSSLLLVSLILLNCLMSCKKNKDFIQRDCKIVARISGNDTTFFTYNADGRINTKISSGQFEKFEYTGNTIVITNTTGNVLNSVTTVTINGNGLASSLKQADATGSNFTNTTYEYDGTQLKKSTSIGSSGGPAEIATYTYLDGNLISFQTGSTLTVLEYANNIPSQTGDFWSDVKLLNGFDIIRTKNAVNLIKSNGNSATLGYNFDAEGKIISRDDISNAGMINTINYKYECK